MNAQELIYNLEAEYYAAIAANPDWQAPTLFDFLVSKDIDPDDIWEYSAQIGWDAGVEEPDWL